MYYGSDSGSVVESPHTQAFYLGKMGSWNERTATDVPIEAGSAFNTSAIQSGTAVYGWWWLGGPGKDPNWDPNTYTTIDAGNWGTEQGVAAIYAATGGTPSKNGLYFSDYVNRQTIFCDVETGGTGQPNLWLTPGNTYNGNTGAQLNAVVVDNFLNQILNSGHPYGVYSSTGEWGTIFGSSTYGLGYAGIVGWFYGDASCGGIPVVINQYSQDPDHDSISGSLPS